MYIFSASYLVSTKSTKLLMVQKQGLLKGLKESLHAAYAGLEGSCEPFWELRVHASGP